MEEKEGFSRKEKSVLIHKILIPNLSAEKYSDSLVSAVFWFPANRAIWKTALIKDWFSTTIAYWIFKVSFFTPEGIWQKNTEFERITLIMIYSMEKIWYHIDCIGNISQMFLFKFQPSRKLEKRPLYCNSTDWVLHL